MQKLLKLKLWITIVLLCYSINLSATNTNNSPTGEVTAKSDSVLIAYSDLRIANSKMIQLEYEKEINKKLRTIVANDSIVIRNYDTLNKEFEFNDKTVEIKSISSRLGRKTIEINKISKQYNDNIIVKDFSFL